MDLGLRGKKALVTGASRGIGLAIAQTLAAEGADVSICARTQGDLDKAATLLSTHGTRIRSEVVDMSNLDAIEGWVKATAEEFSGLDIVVSTVSSMVASGEEGWRSNFELELLAYIRLVNSALPFLQQSDAASIVAIGTTAAVETFGNPTVPYGALKAAMIQHTSGLAQHLAASGIRANVVSPGPVYFEGGIWEDIKGRNPDFYNSTLAAIPRGSMATAEEIANPVVFLASPAASNVTGVNLVVDGGYTKKVKF